jgi:hypothetical protein
MGPMFVAVAKPRARAASGPSADGAAVFRRYPKRDAEGNIEWIHWADLELASAWAREGLRALDAFVAKHTQPVDDARVLEGGGRASINNDAREALLPLNYAFQALNVPPLLSLASEEFGCVNLLWSFVAIRSDRIEVRTTVLSGPGACVKPPSQAAMIALRRAVAADELVHDQGIVVDVRSRQLVFRGGFDAGLAFKRDAPHKDRAYLALWARKPWVLDRGDDVEFIVGEPAVWERDRVVRRVQMARPFMAQIATDPWGALVAARERVRANNDALAAEWDGRVPDIKAGGSIARSVQLSEAMNALAQARSERSLEEARARAREGLASGAGTVVGALGVVSAIAPPAALVLAPAAAVLTVVSALAGLLLQVIPRDWMATAEVVPPRLPVPNMISGDEGSGDVPSTSVPAPPAVERQPARSIAPVGLDLEAAQANATLTATAALVRSPLAPQSRPVTSATIDSLIAAPRADASVIVGAERPSPTRQAPSVERAVLATASRTSHAMTIAVLATAGAIAWWSMHRRPRRRR